MPAQQTAHNAADADEFKRQTKRAERGIGGTQLDLRPEIVKAFERRMFVFDQSNDAFAVAGKRRFRGLCRKKSESIR